MDVQYGVYGRRLDSINRDCGRSQIKSSKFTASSSTGRNPSDPIEPHYASFFNLCNFNDIKDESIAKKSRDWHKLKFNCPGGLQLASRAPAGRHESRLSAV